ncbi:MAG: 2-hydroxyacyl-CoA dehydratase [Candidatus Heimdallarchaeota archaeon]|nr:MAG: 2-hydroxyacyl-CoA dehydratase [Candidatus Heimdallarchaeota archaeon]
MNTYPIRMLSIGSSTQGASERYIQSFGCSWLRHIMDIGIAKGYQALDGVIFSAGTCDSLQNVSDIWRKVFSEQWAYNLTFPVLTDTKAAVEYLQNEFETLVQKISEKFPDNPHGFTITDSIKLYNRKRINLQKLLSLVSERRFRYSDFFKLALLGDILPIETINPYLSIKIEQVESSSQLTIPDSPRLLLSGGMFDSFRLFEEIPEFDQIVTDDLSFGARNFKFSIPQSGFLQGYAQAYLERIPDPTAFDMEKRWKGLEEAIRHHNIEGVILLGMKFCDPDSFEFVSIQNNLKDLDIPYLTLETSPDLSNIQQIQTRLSAYIEMLS